MPEGGIIEIGAKNVVIGAKEGLPLKAGKYVKISVKDHGIGIPEKYLGHIFDPYFTTKQEGSGLGLASCYSIIKKHEGHITVQSEAGVGSTFIIYLPISKKEVFEVKDVVEVRPYFGHGKILLMDDEQDVIEVAEQMLTYLGYEVKFAMNGLEAVYLYKKAKEAGAPFDAVILDLTVPGEMGGGQEAMQKLFEIDPEVKAIVSSGYANDPVLSEYKKHRFSGVVAKPYEINELSKILHKLITKMKKV